ncbi:tol-pal system protein YbgF [Rubripirellula obstinata]|uniref:Tol-pal system protein YbgF n=2 Tax=Rubripirellula obstinata TaxID=406547 RepID=A0A5B1CGN6_9BACT|nr:tol-pal system protein YbgF [Rubripirellula obstinata]
MVTRMSASFNSAAMAAAMFVTAASAPIQRLHAQNPTDQTLSQIDAGVVEGRLDDAANAARRFDSVPSESSVRSLARLANSFSKKGDLPAAAEFFSLAIEHHNRIATGLDDGDLSLPLHLAAISVFVKNNDTERVVSSLSAVAKSSHQLRENQRAAITKIAFQTGRDSLSTGKAALAKDAYRVAEELCDKADVPTAKLGQAWATVVDGGDPMAAAKELGEFVDQYPNHPDAAQATAVCARCLRQAGHDGDADQVLTDLVARFPDSNSAAEIAIGYAGSEPDELPDFIRRWLVDQTEQNKHTRWSAEVAGLALRIASHEGRVDTAMTLTRYLAETDNTGQTVADLLDRMPADHTEPLAAYLISPPTGFDVTEAAREAAARWAGRNQKWNMLAMAAGSESIDRLSAGRTIAVERLFAESLMQIGKTSDAAKWWNHLVDQRDSTDFATLLRCAESEIATGNDTGLAGQRIALARAAAGPNSKMAATLVDLLEAELAIRKSRFDEARSLLENVVRGVEIDTELRGRAQWLIGETRYLQNQFADAIDAYRSVEGVAPDSSWVAASMVQAGKSFEQLGRTREAAVCYGNLLARFADSPHADSARRRMAAISPSQQPSNSRSIRR